MIRRGIFKNFFALKKSGKPKNECSAGINAEFKSLKESVPSDKAKKYILMAARLAGFSFRDSQTPAKNPAPVTPPRKTAPDKQITAQQKPSAAKTAAPLNQLETLLLPPSKTSEPSRPSKTSHQDSSKNEFLRLCRSGSAGKIEAALKKGADANARDDNGRTVFFMWGGRTALTWAVVFDRAEAEEILLQYGADVNARDDKDRTALMIAASYGYTESIRLLLEYGAEINARDDQGRTPMIMAAKYGHAEAIRILLNHGANINATTAEGMTALMLAEEGEYTEAANLIRNYRHTKPASKPAINRESKPAVRNETHNTAIAVRNDRKETSVTNQNVVNVWNVNVNFDEDIFRELDSNINAMVNARDEYGHTILHLAAYNNDAESVEEALNCGADVNARDDEGYTALLYAACFGYSKVAKILLQHGAKVNITYRDPNYSDGVTVLHVAKMNGHDETANVILAFGGTDSHPITTAIHETVNAVRGFFFD